MTAKNHAVPAAEADLSLLPEERWPFFDDDEIAAVVDVMQSGRVNQWTGDEVFAFQSACERRFGGGKGIALANGSVALELALRAFGIGPGDEVIVTPRSFVASAFCVLLVGATPVFADVDSNSGNVSAATIAPLITDRTRAVIPVHLAGWPADVPAILDLVHPRGIRVIEDCAQAHGATSDGRPVGSFGDAAAFSFCQDKIISTAGEGGYLSLRDEKAHAWAWSFKDHGKSFDKVTEPNETPGEFRWLHDNVGTNWRMPGPQAAVGLKQLGKLDDWLAARRRNADIWMDTLSDVDGLYVPRPREGIGHAYYKLYFQLDLPEADAESVRSRLIRKASANDLRLFTGSCSVIYREKAFADLATPHCPLARRLGKTSLMVEVHPTIRPDLLERRAERLADLIRAELA